MTLRPGLRVAERFELEHPIGAGGMGTVYAALDRETGQRVALKLLQQQHDEGSQDSERFAREAQILTELRHPHIVGHVAHGVDEGRPWLAMEWLEGEDLRARLRRGRLTIGESVALLHGVSAALAEAHRFGVVHRDLKPSNLFLRRGDPRDVVVLDFGVARRMVRAGVLTRTGVLVGTPEYMAPEQARGGRDVGPATDVFALGCVVHECLAGQPLFHGEHVAAVLVKVLFEAPTRVQDVRAEVPDALAELLARMLAKEPGERFAHGLALHDAVRKLLRGLQDPAELVTLAAGGATPTSAGTLSLTPQEQQILSLAVAVPRGDEAALTTLTPSEGGERSSGQRAVHEALTALGAGAHVLADGSVVATVFPSASAADQAFVAARCGLLMKEMLPDHEVAVTTGRGLLRGQVPLGASIDRALQLVDRRAATPVAGVWLDELSEDLLAGRLRIVEHDGHPLLLREQDPSTGDEVRRLLGQPTPCVGRDQELATLAAMLTGCVDESLARAVGVAAPPGMGKSRLRHEFMRAASRQHPDLVVLLGRGDVMYAGTVYGLIGQAIRRLCELSPELPPAGQRERLRARLGRHLPANTADRVVPFLGELCRVPFPGDGDHALHAARSDPKLMRDRVLHAFLEWLRAELQHAPVLLVLEDLHWGDALTVQLVDQALRELRELPLCVLALARPEVAELFPGFWTPDVLQLMPLRPLSKRSSERLALEVLRRALGGAVDPATVARIVDQAAGHPLFLEELVRAVAEGRQDSLPETVLTMLIARLSQLDAEARAVLRAASVYGETFTRAGLAALLGDDPGIDAALAGLVQAEFIERPRDGRDHKFRHALVRDAAYGLLTDENRVAAHRLACAYLEHAGTDPAVLAEHAHAGQDHPLAARYHVEAAGQALASFDLVAADRHAARALECGVQDVRLGTVRAIQAWTAYFRLDQLTGYTHALAALEVLPPGGRWWTRAMIVCFYSFFMLGRTEHMDRLIAAFLAAELEPDARRYYLEAGAVLATCFATSGRRRAAASLIERLRQVAAELDPREHAHLLNADGVRTFYLEPTPYSAYMLHRRAELLFHEEDNRHWISQGRLSIALALEEFDRLDESEAVLRQARAVALASGDALYAAIIHMHLGFLLGHRPGGEAEARAIGEAYRDGEYGPAMAGALGRIRALAALAAGDQAAAEAEIAAALASVEHMRPYHLGVRLLHVELLLAQGRVAEARASAELGLRLVDVDGGLGHVEVPVRLAAAVTRRADGDVDAARAALADALAALRPRAADVADPELRASYLGNPTNRRLLALAAEHGLAL